MTLEMNDISRSFGSVQALSHVSFSLGKGEIHGLLGENGAGKTTLMNILSGGIQPDSGSIVIDGQKIRNMTPRKAGNLGIRFIHQELSLCNDLKVYQNMFLGSEYSDHGFVNRKKEIERAREVLTSLSLEIDPEVYVSELETAEKQLVEIARALLFKSEIIIMDEPTTALNTKEIDQLFRIMRQQKEKGVSFIYISHKMPEIFSICDKYTVLRDGHFIKSGNIADINEKEATELLVGKSFQNEIVKDRYGSSKTDEVVLEVSGLSSSTFHNVSFCVHRGEIVIITGLQGSGTDELAEALFGASDTESGTIKSIRGSVVSRNIARVMRSGIGMIPKNRKERGISPDLSIERNSSSAYFTALHDRLFISKKAERNRFENNRRSLDIKIGSPDDPITSLSGGNQQKVILGKWLNIDADVYIMDNPTQGIDVGAKFAIYDLINRIAGNGKGIIVFTNEYPEMLQVADRVLVMYKGQIVSDIPRSDMNEALIMAYSTGSMR